jgi:integrase
VLEQRLRAGSEWQELGLVFCSEVGTPVDLSNLRNRSFKRILRRAGLPADLRPYDLRHSAATLLLLAGEHPKVVSERLGHSTVALTLDTYSHALPTLQQQATEKIASVLYGDREP